MTETALARRLKGITVLTVIFSCFLLLHTGGGCLAEDGKISVAGITEPFHDAVLSLSVYGRIAKIFFQEGGQVKKDEAILELDNRLEELEAQRRKLVWESKAELDSAAKKAATLESLLKGTRDLYRNAGSVSKEALDKEELEYALALSEVKRIQSMKDRERLEYEIAVEQLRKRTLRAPFAGAISEILVDLGEHCEPDEPLARIVDTSRCYFVCNMEAKLGRALIIGEAVDLRIQGGDEAISRKGEIVFISPTIDPASGLRKVKAVFDNKDGKVSPGAAGEMVLED